jgi:hypothetical protein
MISFLFCDKFEVIYLPTCVVSRMNHFYVLINLYEDVFYDNKYYNFIFGSPAFTLNMIKEQEITKFIEHYYFSYNPNITWEYIQNNPGTKTFDGWEYSELSKNSNITWDIVQANPDKQWSYTIWSRNPNINIEIVKSNMDKPWDWGNLSSNPSITMEDVITNPDLPWNFNNLSCNPNISWEMYNAYSHKSWNISYLGANPGIDWDDIYNDTDTDWNWHTVCANPNVTWETIQEHSDLLNDYEMMSQNPNITYSIVETNKDKEWDLFDNYNLDILTDRVDKYDIRIWKYYMCENSTWRDIVPFMEGEIPTHSDRDRRSLPIMDKEMNRWNASSKIQHKFRRWYSRVRKDIFIIILRSVLPELPPEICLYLHNLGNI